MEKYIVIVNQKYLVSVEAALVAFVLLFDYGHSKANDTAAFHSLFGCKSADGLPYKDSLHKRVEALGDRTLFCVSVAVHPDHRRKGLASCLIDLVLDRYADYGVVADVSNAASLAPHTKLRYSSSAMKGRRGATALVTVTRAV